MGIRFSWIFMGKNEEMELKRVAYIIIEYFVSFLHSLRIFDYI